MKARKGCVLSGGILLLILGVTVCLAGGWWVWQTQMPQVEQPVLRVFQPQPNASLNAGIPVQVQASAQAQNSSVAWLRFYVDNLLSGEQSGPARQIIGTWNWTPRTAGMHTLTFVAATDQGVENMVTQTVMVLAAVDQDGDNLPDEQDACPQQAGAEFNQGCPIADDADGDGIRDADDACPQEAGVVDQRGCLMGNRPDQDRDGTADWDDRCPSQAGLPQWNGCPQEALLTDRDADGIVDAVDWCPQQPGLADNHGCPNPQADDGDGDGIADAQDVCPHQPGAAGDGCPLLNDRDQDGIPDESDSCPDNPNPNFECVEVIQLTDSDGDGVWDVIDDCDNEAGSLDHHGCPMPDDQDGDGMPDDQDNCDDRPGPAGNSGCPAEMNYPRVKGENNSIVCMLFPSQCEPQDPCEANPASCDSDEDGVNNQDDQCPAEIGIPPNGCPVFPNDRDGDGVPDQHNGHPWDRCPDQYGVNQGCPVDRDQDGIPDPDQDSDGVPDSMDSCPNVRGMESNHGCPRQEVDLTLFLSGFATPQQAYSNFYCYATLQDHYWGRIPQEGSLDGSGTSYLVNQSISLHLSANEFVRFRVLCEGQTDPLIDAQEIGYIERAHGPESWNSQYIVAFSENGQLVVEYRICEGSCR
ncbi:MAG: thrombospondin type 3 repeat-containing protein [Chloroflexota bacterium]